jgi:hypothetical protein
MELLAHEVAPVSTWIDIAVRRGAHAQCQRYSTRSTQMYYYRSGNHDMFQAILEQPCSDEARELLKHHDPAFDGSMLRLFQVRPPLALDCGRKTHAAADSGG